MQHDAPFAAFNALHRPALERDEAKHNLILALMARAEDEDPPGQTRKFSFGEPGACAVQTPGRGLVMGEMRREHCEAFADQMTGQRFNSVMGPDRSALWFRDRAEVLGVRFGEPWRQRILAISAPPVYPDTPGEARLVTSADIELFAEWVLAFCHEAIPHDPLPQRAHTERQAASGNYLFWVAEGRPVSMAGIHRRTRTGASIGGVYTPPDLRGRGFAGAVTSAAVGKIYSAGRTMACLYADMANPWSNRCYEKIGFTQVCESTMFPQAD
jgi:GNAT superfamily N-acetyltransferase